MAAGKAEGPLLLGHILPGPKKTDEVVNSGGITPFPPDMRIWPTTAVDFRFSNSHERAVETNVGAGAPIPVPAPVTVNAEAGVVFRRMMGSTWDIDQLDTQIMQPTLAYLEQCRRSPQVSAWVEKNKTLGAWTLYMISGLMIARGAKGGLNVTNETEVQLASNV